VPKPGVTWLPTSSLSEKNAASVGGIFFFYPQFRIAGWEGIAANFVGVEGSINQRLLLWGSGGKLTRTAFRIQGCRVQEDAARLLARNVEPGRRG
jgi:hypothetical protein